MDGIIAAQTETAMAPLTLLGLATAEYELPYICATPESDEADSEI
jgi:hypothetical protein